MRRVAIVGCAKTWRDAPFTDASIEIWAHTSGQPLYGHRRIDRWYDIHRLEIWRQGKVWYRPKPGDPQTYVEWLASRPQPIVMQQHWPIVPTSVAYPLREIVEAFGIVPPEWHMDPDSPEWWDFVKDRGEFTSTFTYMLAQALYEGVAEVSLYGIDFWGAEHDPVSEFERLHQRPGAKYWVGVARGMGIPVNVSGTSWFQQNRWLYGYQERPQLQEA